MRRIALVSVLFMVIIGTAGSCSDYETSLSPEWSASVLSKDVSGNQPIQFSSLSCNATQWNWNFDGKITSTSQIFTQTFTKTGSYDVVLDVSDGTTIESKAIKNHISVVISGDGL